MKRKCLSAILCLVAGAVALVGFGCADVEANEAHAVTFMSEGEEFDTLTVEYGGTLDFDALEFEQGDPVKEDDDEYTYTFLGWSGTEGDTETLSGKYSVYTDETFYAVFGQEAVSPDDRNERTYKVVFKYYVDGELWSSQQEVKYGCDAADPSLSEDFDIYGRVGHTFVGWDKNLTNIRGNRTITAEYEKNIYKLHRHYLGTEDVLDIEFEGELDFTQGPEVARAFVWQGTWYADEACSEPIELTEMPAHDVHVYTRHELDFGTAVLQTEGDMVYGDADDSVWLAGLRTAAGLVYRYDWTVNGESVENTESRYALGDAGDYAFAVHISAKYSNADGSYILTQEEDVTGDFLLDKATLTAEVAISAADSVYGDEVPTVEVVYSGFKNGETSETAGVVTVSQYLDAEESAVTVQKDFVVGGYTIAPALAENKNYKAPSIERKSFTVKPRDLHISLSVDDYVYGTGFAPEIDFHNGFVYEDSAASLGEHNFRLDDVRANPIAEGAIISAGAHRVRLQGYASQNYTVHLPEEAAFTVAKRQASAALSATGGVYGVDPAPSYTFDNVLEEDEAKFTPTWSFTREGSGAYADASRFVVGNYTVDAVFTEQGSDNYEPLTVTGTRFEITKKALAVSVSVNESYIYGDPVSPSAVFEDAFEFEENEHTSGLLKGVRRFVYRTVSAPDAEYNVSPFAADRYTVEVAGYTADNYEFSFPKTSFEVEKKALTLTVHLIDDDLLYGETPKTSAASGYYNGVEYNGFIASENARTVFGNALPTVSYYKMSGEAAADFHTGDYYATTTADPANYAVTVVRADFTVRPRTLYVGISLDASSLVYGEKPHASPVYAHEGYDGFLAGEERLAGEAYIEYRGTQTYTQSELDGDAKMIAGSYALSVKGIPALGDYTLTYQEGVTFTVEKKALTVTLTDGSTYTYGDTPHVGVQFGAFAYDENETSLFGAKASAICYFKDGASEHYAVKKYFEAGSYTATLEGLENANYTIDVQDASFTVAQKKLTVTVTAEGFTYGDKALPAPALKYDGFVPGENEDVLGGAPAYSYLRDGKEYSAEEYFDAGSYTVSVEGYASPNYDIHYENGTFNIAKRRATVTVSATGGTYGDTPSFGYTMPQILSRDLTGFGFAYSYAFSRTANGNKSAYVPSERTYYQAGNYTVTLTYRENTNYTLTVQSADFAIAKKGLTVGIEGVTDSYVYGTVPQPKLTFNGFVSGEGESVFTARPKEQFTYYNADQQITSIRQFPFGAYYVGATEGYTADNYAVSSAEKTAFRITKAPLTVTVTAGDITYGDAPKPTISFSPFAYEENERVLSGSASYTYLLGGVKKEGLLHAGKYTVEVGGFTATNYDIHYVSDTFTVNKKALTVSATVADITYGETPAPHVSYNGFIRTESYSNLAGELTYAYSDAKNSEGFLRAGEHTLTLSGYLSDDYAITYETATFKVSPKKITVSVTDTHDFADFTYDGSRTLALSSTVSGLVEGDTGEGLGTLNYALKGVRYPSANVKGVLRADSYTFTASGYASDDYIISYVYGTESKEAVSFTVSPSEVTLTLKKGWNTYGDDTADAWFKTAGSIYNDELKFTTSINKDSAPYTGGDKYLPCGKYTVTVSYNVNPDYRVTSDGEELNGSDSVSFTVEPKTVKVSASGSQPWAKRREWSYVPTLGDDRFVLTGTIVLTGADGLSAQEYKATDVNGVFGWKDGFKITLKEGGADVTANFKFTYAFTLMLNDSAFRIEKPSNSTFTYDSEEHSFEVKATAEGVDAGDIHIQYKTDEQGNYKDTVPKFTAAGDYTVYYKVTAPNCKDEVGSFAVKGNKATPVLENVKDAASYTYDNAVETLIEEKKVHDAVVKRNVYSDATVEYSLTGSEFGNFPNVRNANSYTITVKVSGDNYETATATYTLTVGKAAVTAPVIAHKTYNKGAQTATVDAAGALYTVQKNEGGTDAGEYDVVLALNDPSNYKWAGKSGDEESATLTLKFVIDKATLDMGGVKWDYTAEEKSFTYDKTAHTVALTGLPADGDIEVAYQNAQGTAAGEYRAVATLTYDNANYNEITTEWKLTWNIAKADYTVSGVKDDTGYTYNGAAQGRTLDELKRLVTALEGDEFEVSFVGAGQFTAAGEHAVKYTVTGNDNYNDIEDGAYTVKIGKAKAGIDASDITFGDLKGEGASYSATYRGTPYSVEWSKAKPTDDFNGTLTADLIHITGASSFTNYQEGGYTVTLTIDGTNNYDGASLTYKITIDKAEYIVTEPEAKEFTYNGTAQGDPVQVEVKGSDQFTLRYGDGGYQFINANEAGYTVTYTVSGNDNYNDKSGTYTLTINKAEYVVTEPKVKEFTYNGTEQGGVVTAAGVHEGDVIGEITYGGGYQFTDAGEHEVTYSVSGNDNYNEKTGTYTVNIGKAEAQLDVKDITTAYTFTAKEQTVNLDAAQAKSNIEGATGYGAITFEKDGALITEFKFTNVAEGNGVTITVKLSDGRNFIGAETTVALTVAKANYTVSAPAQNFDYDATEHGNAIAVSGLAEDSALQAGDYTVTYNGEETVAQYKNYQDGGYPVQYAVSESANYNAANGSYKIVINKAKPTLENVTDTAVYTYDKDTETQVTEETVRNAVVKDNVYSDATVEYSLTGSEFGSFPTIKNANSYTITVKVSGANYEETTATYTLTVAKKSVTVTLPVNIDTTYDGNEHGGEGVKFDVHDEFSNVVYSISYSVDSGITEEAPKFKNVGLYSVTVKVTPTENYTFEGKDGNFEDTYTVTINKAKAEINTSDIDFGDFEKDGDYTYSATYKGAAYTVDWTVAKPADDFNGTLTTNIVVTGASSFTDANTYTVTLSLAGNANYDTADDVKFTITINKAKAVIDASQITFGDFVKGDNDYSYSATYRGTPYTVDWSKATSNFGSVTNDATEIKNADTYVVTLSVAGTDNYEGDTKEFTITIKRKQLTKPAEDTDSFTYNKNAQTYTLSGFDDASMKIEGASLTQTNAGDYQFTVILSDKTNYEWVGGTQDDLVFTFHIAKATLEKLPEGVSKPTIGEQVNWYGKTLNDIGLGEDWYWETSDSELTLGEETYNIFYNSDRANYEDYVTTIKFTTVRTQLKLQFSKERQTNGIEVEYTDWAAKTAEEFAGSYTLVGTNRGNADIKTLAEEMEYFYYLWKGGPFSLNTPFQDGKIYGGTYLLLYRFFLEEDNPYYEWATDQDPTELDSALMLKIKSVEYAGTLYTIEDALHTATGGTITVKYNTAFAYPEVREEFGVYGDESYYTVKSGVTLKLPYDGTNTYGSPGADSSGTSALSFGDSSKQQLLVSVPANVTVINRGKIEVGGYVTGSGAGNLAGQTYDKYARIDLGENARIESYGDIDVYGFITESTWNNGSEVIMHSGSMKMPFVVVEHRGGSAFSNFKDDLSGAPFNRFFLHNVSAQLTFESASNLYGDAKLKTDKKSFIPAQENQTNIHLIGTDTKALIQLEARSKVVAKLQAEAFEKAYAQSPIKLEVYGDMTLHALSLKVTVTIITVDVTTKGVLFPLSWYWQVTLNPLTKGGTATVNATDQDFKLLPGAKLTIEKGVTLQAQKVAVYKANSWTDAGVGTSNKYETNKGDGILTVNGTLTVNEFGGEVQSGANDAILQVNSKSTILSKEVKSSTGNALEGGSLTWDEINLSLGFTSGTADGVGTYVCTNGTWAKTEKTQQSFTYTVKYHYNDDSDTTEEKKGTILYVNTPAWEITNLDYALIRDFYRFTGWYMESACETPFESWTAKPDAVLDVYAGWEKIEYVINYHFSGAGSELVNPNTSAWSFGEDVALQPATSRGKNGDLTFGGWFFDAGYTQPASVINTETIGEHGYENRFGEHIIDVYAYFSDLNQEYEISYDLALELGYEDISFAAPTGFKIKIGQTLTAEMLPTDAALTKYDTDFTKQYYFDGWLANGKKVQGGTAISGADIVDGKLVLTANWAEKVKLNITLQAKGSSGFFGSAKTASCTVKIDGTQVATPSVKSEKGGSLQTEILNYYLKPGQSYEITKGEGTLSGATSGTAEADKDITVTVTNT